MFSRSCRSTWRRYSNSSRFSFRDSLKKFLSSESSIVTAWCIPPVPAPVVFENFSEASSRILRNCSTNCLKHFSRGFSRNSFRGCLRNYTGDSLRNPSRLSHQISLQGFHWKLLYKFLKKFLQKIFLCPKFLQKFLKIFYYEFLQRYPSEFLQVLSNGLFTYWSIYYFMSLLFPTFLQKWLLKLIQRLLFRNHSGFFLKNFL